MTVAELIEALKTMPQECQVYHIWDGEPLSRIMHVWLSRAGHVMTADENEVVYSEQALPVGAQPPDDGSCWWQTPKAVEKP